MKVTVYCDHNGILRYNPEGWPDIPVERDFSKATDPMQEYDNAVLKWIDDMRNAKSESVPFENQKITAEWAHIKPDSFYDVEINGTIEIVFLTELDSGNLKDIGCKVTGLGSRGYTNRYARIVKNELSGNSEQLQSSDPNSPNYIISTNVITNGMDHAWLELWEQIEIWYGDVRKEETGEELLMRLQKTFNLTKK